MTEDTLLRIADELESEFDETSDEIIELYRGRKKKNRGGRRTEGKIAAVLVALQANVEKNDYDILMIRRASNVLDIHSREIGFPGGMMERLDNKNPVNTAIREAWEEIGLPKDRVEVFKVMRKFSTRTGFSIIPVFGRIDGSDEINWDLDYTEVSNVLRIKLSSLTAKGSRIKHIHIGKFGYKEMPAYSSKSGLIWGASAIILEKIIRAHNNIIV